MIAWLSPSIFANLIGAVISGSIYAFLYRGDRRSYLGIWSMAWFACALGATLMLMRMLLAPEQLKALALIGGQLSILTSGLLLLWGSFAFIGRNFSIYWIYIGAPVAIYNVIAGLLNFSPVSISLPTFLFLGWVYIYTGIIFLRQTCHLGKFVRVIGVVFIIWGLHKLDYPFLRTLEWAAPLGYMVGAALEILVAIGLLVLYFQEAQRQMTMSEEKYRELVENANSILLKWDRKGEITFLNEYGLNFFGFRPEEIIGRPVVGTIVPETEVGGRNLAALMDDIFANPSGHEKNLNENILKDGTRVWIAWTNRPVYDFGGKVLSMFSVGTDITDIKRAEQALRDTEAKMRSIFRAAPVGIGVVVDRVIQDVNTLFCDITGYEREELIGQSARMVYPSDEEFEKVGNQKYSQISARGTGTVQARLKRKDGRIIDVLLASTPLDPEDLTAGITFTVLDITQRVKAENEAKVFKTIADRTIHGNAIADLNGNLVYVNESFAGIHGYSADELMGKNLSIFHREHQTHTFRQKIDALHHFGTFGPEEVWHRHRDGHDFPMLMGGVLLPDEYDKPKQMAACAIDMTEMKQLESQLLQAQKMESVGRLAGGVAHDFNNILSIILGYSEICLSKLEPTNQLYPIMEEIFDAAKRSENIVQQLLTFARQQTAAPQVLDLNETIENMLKMLRRLIGENINLAWSPESDLWPVKIDPTQVDQIIANLCVNARDAIDNAGKITIETSMTTLDDESCAKRSYYYPGKFVVLTISDNGCGMDEKTLTNIFDPFFSTKKMERGTGLGLATVYGIVKQNGGFIDVFSEPGRGATFKIFLPRHSGQAAPAEVKEDMEIPEGQGETILLVEDDASALNLIKKMLESLGYRVMASAIPTEAVQLAEKNAADIHLLITDVVMPGLNGRELVALVKDFCPDVPFLYISGYTADVISSRGFLETGTEFMAKPFSKQELAVKIAEMLNQHQEA